MKKKVMYIIGAIIIIGVIIIFAAKLFGEKDSEQDENDSSENLAVECTSSADCGQVSIESYCENNSAYNRLHDFSCIDGECIEKIKKPELINTCSSKSKCKDGVCEPVSVPINSCGFYLNTKGTYYKLTKDITDNNLSEPCITIMKDNVTFDCDGYSIRSDSAYSGVYSEENNYVTIKNCDIEMSKANGGYGIYLYNNIYSQVLDNTLDNQYIGLYLNWDTNAVIKGNQMKSNNKTGFWIEKSSNNKISDNTACKNTGKDVKIISSSNIKGIGNKFGTIDSVSGEWPILDENYINCSG